MAGPCQSTIGQKLRPHTTYVNTHLNIQQYIVSVFFSVTLPDGESYVYIAVIVQTSSHVCADTSDPRTLHVLSVCLFERRIFFLALVCFLIMRECHRRCVLAHLFGRPIGLKDCLHLKFYLHLAFHYRGGGNPCNVQTYLTYCGTTLTKGIGSHSSIVDNLGLWYFGFVHTWLTGAFGDASIPSDARSRRPHPGPCCWFICPLHA
jgi:hypothetical protein